MVADKNKMATECWKKGTEAMNRNQWDYSVEMFFRAMTFAPENVLYRKTLRGATKKLYKDNGAGARLAGVKLMKTRGKIKKHQLTKNWQSVDSTAEEGLKINPWDASLNATVGAACKHLGFDDVALFSYELAVQAQPESIEFNRQLALLHEERSNYQEAIACWSKIYKINPMDSQARSKMTQLAADTVIDRGGYEGAESTRDVKTGYDYDRPGVRGRAVPGQTEPDGPGMSEEADLERAIRKDETNIDNYLKLADLFKRENRLDEAFEKLKTALDLSGGDHTIREQLEDVELDGLRHNLDLAKEAFRANREDENAKKAAVKLAKELLSREIEYFSSRVERYPKNCKLKLQLARRHMQRQDFRLAIPLLQQTVADSRLECEALVDLGNCFYQDKKQPLALRQFEKAQELVDLHDRPDLFKKIHFALGMLYEVKKDWDRAEEHYQEVLGVDYQYRDTLKRLERLQSMDRNAGEEDD